MGDYHKTVLLIWLQDVSSLSITTSWYWILSPSKCWVPSSPRLLALTAIETPFTPSQFQGWCIHSIHSSPRAAIRFCIRSAWDHALVVVTDGCCSWLRMHPEDLHFWSIHLPVRQPSVDQWNPLIGAITNPISAFSCWNPTILRSSYTWQ